MEASKLIEARERGDSLDKILHAVEAGRRSVSSISEDTIDFLESMIAELMKAASEMNEALSDDNISKIKDTASSLGDIIEMIKDTCNDSTRIN